MSESIKREQIDADKAIVLSPAESKSLSIDDFKSIYYLLNARPDTDIKLFPETKRVRLTDILELNHKVQEKIRNHNMVTNMSKVVIALSNKRVLDYSSWAEFERSNWDMAAYTESVCITWEMNFQLPAHKVPQPHTMRLKIGSQMNPTEMFHVMVSKDMHDIEQMLAHAVCKIDFINTVLCNELFGIVAEWHEALPALVNTGRFEHIVRKYRQRIEELVVFLIVSAGILVLLSISHYTIDRYLVDVDRKALLERICQWSALSFVFVYLIYLLGRGFSRWITRNVKMLKDQASFAITKGDSNRINTISEDNQKVLKEVAFQICISGLIFILGTVLSGAIGIIKTLWSLR